MTLKKLPILLAVLGFVAAFPALAEEKTQEIDWKKGAWGDLSQYIGTYNYDAILTDNRVAAALEKLMGKKDLAKLMDNMDVRGSVDFQDDCLMLSGNAPQKGGEEGAITAVCVYEGVVHAALQHKGKITLYTTSSKYEYLPFGLRVWVYGQVNKASMGDMPDGVEFVLAD